MSNFNKFDPVFKIKAITAMIVDKTFLEQAEDIIFPEHFETESQKWIVEKILWYFRKYKGIITAEAFKREADKIQIKELRDEVITTLKEVYRNLTSTDIQYVKDEYLVFCQNQAMKIALVKSIDKLDAGKFDEIRTLISKAMQAGTERSIGHLWKEDVEQRLVEDIRHTIPTGWTVIDNLVEGGLGAGELGMIIGSSGAGKSWSLCALGLSALKHGKNVIHFTLELNEKYVGRRYDSLAIGVSPNSVQKHSDEVKAAVNNHKGTLLIKQYPSRTVTAFSLKAYIERARLKGIHPDLIIVDYADLLRSTQKTNARYEELGIIYEELRGLATEEGVPLWTVSQAQRAAAKDDVIEGDRVAESYGKIMTSDFIMSLSRKTEDKVSNSGRAHVIKNRFGQDGLTFPMIINYGAGIIDIVEERSPQGQQLKTQQDKGRELLERVLNGEKPSEGW